MNNGWVDQTNEIYNKLGKETYFLSIVDKTYISNFRKMNEISQNSAIFFC